MVYGNKFNGTQLEIMELAKFLVDMKKLPGMNNPKNSNHFLTEPVRLFRMITPIRASLPAITK